MKKNQSTETVSLTEEQITELIAFKKKVDTEKAKWNQYSKRRSVITNLLIKKALSQGLTVTQKEIDDYVPGTKLNLELAIVPEEFEESELDSPTE